MHIHTHVACNAQDLNFKFKLKLGVCLRFAYFAEIENFLLKKL